MTLNTRVWLTGPIHGEQAFDLALRAILTAGEVMDRYEAVIIQREAAGTVPDWAQNHVGQPNRNTGEIITQEWADGHSTTRDRIMTQIGQGLPAITDCEYRADGSPLAPEDTWVDDDDEPYIDQRACTVEISWDTAYGYGDRNGGCSKLHARALVILAGSLPEGVSLRWQDEFTGDIHDEVTSEALNRLVGSEEGAQRLVRFVKGLVAAQGKTTEGDHS